MIARTWRATAADAGAYRRHFEDTVLPALGELDGHRGAYLMERDDPAGTVEIQVVTLWESMDAVRAFTGPDTDGAVVEPAARAALTGYDTTVTHYEVVLAP
ncbi:hypothetical protein [Spirillospora sp. NPDC047279]|uniref:hypothetical protein n=1 Tax=Spirillospora sp. NPDC047279 TaxID=3155478 RepID=UPI0033CD5C86